MNLKDFMGWAFQALIAGSVIYGVNTIDKMQDSIESLNTNIAVIIEKSAWHERAIEKQDQRLSALEDTSNKRRK